MQDAAKTVIEKNFGLDDGKHADWSAEKRRAYGGMYRYRALSYVQKQGNWEGAVESLQKAFGIDPTLAIDLDLFYEFALAHVFDYKDAAYRLNLEENAKQIMSTITKVFDENPALASLRTKTIGTANYALGLVAYNTYRRTDLSKRFLFNALVHFPKLLLDRKVVFTLIKSFVNLSLVDQLKQFISGKNHAG